MVSQARDGSRRYVALVVLAVALTGFTMRIAVTSIGAVLDDLEAGLPASAGVAGVITTLPVIVFALLGFLGPTLAHRVGEHRLVVASLAVSTIGLAGRAISPGVWLFGLLSLLALAGGAIANVLMPALVKRHFPDRIGIMTATYTTSLAIGSTAAAGLTVPIAEATGGWRSGIGSWAIVAALAALPWLPTLRHDRPEPGAQRGLSANALLRSPTAWALTVFFAFQSFQAYIAFGWFAKFMHAHGVTSGTAGAMVAVLSAMTIPVSMVVPSMAASRHRVLLIWLTVCYLVAYVGLAVAPVGGAWVWMVLVGIGSGQFPLALTMIGLRSRTSDTTAALSAFVQAIGYVVAGTGPLLFGVLNGLTHGWALPLSLLFIALAFAFVAGWRAAVPRFVDDELAPSQA